MPDEASGGTFEIPVLQPFQFEPGGNGDVSRSVNLFSAAT